MGNDREKTDWRVCRKVHTCRETIHRDISRLQRYRSGLTLQCLAMPMLLLPRRVRRKRVVTSKIVQLASKMGIESDCGDAGAG